MLYAADLLVTDTGDVTVAAGTVFGEIIVWSCSMHYKEGRVTNRLRGHEGSVFAVRFHADGRWIASCSDDRTIRVWDLHSTAEEDEERETTGFEEVEGEAKGGKGCVALGWGHQARPWGVRFLPAAGEEVRLASVSEDLTARFWEFTPPGPKRTAVLENSQTWMLHQGKNIWSFAFDYDRQLMATGGADGRVVVLDYSDDAELREDWALEDVVPVPEEKKEEEEEVGDEGNVVKKKKKEKKNAFKNYAIVDKERFVVTTVFGQVCLYSMLDKSWRSLGTWEALRNWSVVGAWEGTGIMALGDIEGKLGILDTVNNQEWWWDAGGRGKVADVFIQGKDGDYFQVVTTSVGSTASVLHTFRLSGDAPPIRRSLVLQPPTPKFTVTSVLISPPARQLFLGSRTGDLAAYSLPSPDCSSAELAPVSYHPTLYSTDALTSLALSSNSLLTTSFSGIHTANTLPSLDATHISKPGNITNITGQFFSGSNNEELNIYGFRGTRFVVYNTSTSTDTLTIDCGGGHRAWTFSPSESRPWFIWTQGTRVHSSRSLRLRHAVLKYGSHGREIKAATFCPRTRLLATGAEDTTIRISHVSDEGRVEERGAVTVKRHTTGILHQEWSEDGERLFSSGGVDELFVFRVRLGEDRAIGVVEESLLPVPKSEAEVRICGIDVVGKAPGEYWVAGAMSDGQVKVWSYRPEENMWALKRSQVYGTFCILHAKFLKLDSGIALLVAATDGHLAIYNSVDLEMKQVWKKRVHQSSIKALTSVVSPDGEIAIYTGGDDCATAVTRVQSEGWVTKECKLLPRAHASAVTAVLPADGGRLVTVGVDQRVKVWDRAFGRLGEVGSAVADCSGAVLIPGGFVVLGVGIECWRLG
ncbi:WD40 repeat-like protein [Wilcoxina mikolae CBS 423.85]|nr:WD40 repeat-like protein [Wilcoxina mikolae CBS 423.85]